MTGIETLRRVAKWCDSQHENNWLPIGGVAPTVEDILSLYSLCVAWGVDTPEDLRTHPDKKARDAYREWGRRTGRKVFDKWDRSPHVWKGVR